MTWLKRKGNWLLRQGSFLIYARLPIPDEKRPMFISAFTDLQNSNSALYSKIEALKQDFIEAVLSSKKEPDYDTRMKIVHTNEFMAPIELVPILRGVQEKYGWDNLTMAEFVSFIMNYLGFPEIPAEIFDRNYIPEVGGT